MTADAAMEETNPPTEPEADECRGDIVTRRTVQPWKKADVEHAGPIYIDEPTREAPLCNRPAPQ